MADSQWPGAKPTTRPAVLVGVFACIISSVVAFKALRTPPIDLEVFRAGGQAVLDWIPLYERPLWSGMDFTYPPLAALLFVPLAILPTIAAQALVTAANLAALVFAVWLARRALDRLDSAPGRALIGLTPLAAGLLFWVEAVRTTVYLGQVNLALLVLVLADLLRDDARRSKGIGVGIAAGIKLTPLIFVLYLLTTRRFRAAAVATGTFLGTVGLGFVLLPRDAAKYWLTGTFADSGRVFAATISPANQSLRGLLFRIIGASGVAELFWMMAAIGITACVLGVAAWASRRNEELLALTLCGLCAAAVSPHSWGHHWVWLVPLAVFLVHLALTRSRWPRDGLWLLPVLLLPLTLPWIVALANPPTGTPRLTTGPLAFLLDNVYVLIFAVTLVASVRHLRHAYSTWRIPIRERAAS
jgi:alpha-1,2-mannosyltransferase